MVGQRPVPGEELVHVGGHLHRHRLAQPGRGGIHHRHRQPVGHHPQRDPARAVGDQGGRGDRPGAVELPADLEVDRHVSSQRHRHATHRRTEPVLDGQAGLVARHGVRRRQGLGDQPDLLGRPEVGAHTLGVDRTRLPRVHPLVHHVLAGQLVGERVDRIARHLRHQRPGGQHRLPLKVDVGVPHRDAQPHRGPRVLGPPRLVHRVQRGLGVPPVQVQQVVRVLPHRQVLQRLVQHETLRVRPTRRGRYRHHPLRRRDLHEHPRAVRVHPPPDQRHTLTLDNPLTHVRRGGIPGQVRRHPQPVRGRGPHPHHPHHRPLRHSLRRVVDTRHHRQPPIGRVVAEVTPRVPRQPLGIAREVRQEPEQPRLPRIGHEHHRRGGPVVAVLHRQPRQVHVRQPHRPRRPPEPVEHRGVGHQLEARQVPRGRIPVQHPRKDRTGRVHRHHDLDHVVQQGRDAPPRRVRPHPGRGRRVDVTCPPQRRLLIDVQHLLRPTYERVGEHRHLVHAHRDIHHPRDHGVLGQVAGHLDRRRRKVRPRPHRLLGRRVSHRPRHRLAGFRHRHDNLQRKGAARQPVEPTGTSMVREPQTPSVDRLRPANWWLPTSAAE